MLWEITKIGLFIVFGLPVIAAGIVLLYFLFVGLFAFGVILITKFDNLITKPSKEEKHSLRFLQHVPFLNSSFKFINKYGKYLYITGIIIIFIISGFYVAVTLFRENKHNTNNNQSTANFPQNKYVQTNTLECEKYKPEELWNMRRNISNKIRELTMSGYSYESDAVVKLFQDLNLLDRFVKNCQ